MKLQVTLKSGTFLHKHFTGVVKDRADEARRLMERGLRAGSFEQVIAQAVRENMADLSIVAALPTPSGDGVEDPAARATMESALGDYGL